jgi:periplasmic divalent cation tolerance protein
MKLVAVYTTVAHRDDARRIARLAVESHLAACVHIETIESCYFWNGALQQDAELRLMFKTAEDRYAELRTALLGNHPYEMPAVWAVPIVDAEAAYADWVVERTRVG